MSSEHAENLWESLTATLVLAAGLASLGVLVGSVIVMLVSLVTVGPIAAAKVAAVSGVTLCIFVGAFALVRP